jgi:hypothetical protein
MSDLELQEFKRALAQLSLRANRIGYKNKQPKLPGKINPQSMRGFNKRLANWTNILNHIENERATLQVKEDPQLLRNYLSN